MAQCNGRQVHDGFGRVPKLRHFDEYYNEGWVYDCYSSSSKGGHLCQEVCLSNLV